LNGGIKTLETPNSTSDHRKTWPTNGGGTNGKIATLEKETTDGATDDEKEDVQGIDIHNATFPSAFFSKI
jgi:hypothetical protein